LLSELEYGSYLVYPTRDSSDVGRNARAVVDAIKNDRGTTIKAFARKLAAENTVPFADMLGSDVVLVPVPRKAPAKAGTLWPAQRICEELLAAGFGKQIAPLIARATAVRSSRMAGLGNRPLPKEHFESFKVTKQSILGLSRITLVDDVVTKGATAIAAASRLAIAYPGVQITLFAAARTKGMDLNTPSVVSPFRGRIKFFGIASNRED
jgi:predicted amidophosphoribosyltransferase